MRYLRSLWSYFPKFRTETVVKRSIRLEVVFPLHGRVCVDFPPEVIGGCVISNLAFGGNLNAKGQNAQGMKEALLSALVVGFKLNLLLCLHPSVRRLLGESLTESVKIQLEVPRSMLEVFLWSQEIGLKGVWLVGPDTSLETRLVMNDEGLVFPFDNLVSFRHVLENRDEIFVGSLHVGLVHMGAVRVHRDYVFVTLSQHL